MAYKSTLICDRCKHEETGESVYEVKRSGWKEVEIKTSGYNSGRTLKEYLMCPKCCEVLDIADKKSSSVGEAQTVADRLVECIVEIVAEVTPHD